MRRLAALFVAALAFGALAQPPAAKPVPKPAPSAAPAAERLPEPGERVEEPQVRIPVQEGDQVEEIREGGRVVMLKVTPKNGPTYYLVDTTGNGNWMRRDSLDDGVRVPMWPVKEFD
jgi:hypothetical protein